MLTPASIARHPFPRLRNVLPEADQELFTAFWDGIAWPWLLPSATGAAPVRERFAVVHISPISLWFLFGDTYVYIYIVFLVFINGGTTL